MDHAVHVNFHISHVTSFDIKTLIPMKRILFYYSILFIEWGWVIWCSVPLTNNLLTCLVLIISVCIHKCQSKELYVLFNYWSQINILHLSDLLVLLCSRMSSICLCKSILYLAYSPLYTS